MTRVLVFITLILLFVLGVNYRPKQNINYSEVKALETHNGVTKVDFKFLGGFDYEQKKTVPKPVKNLNGKKIELAGYMLPVDFDEGKVNSFLLMNSRMACCFGVMPRINEFVFVKMPDGKTAEFMTDIPINVSGRFEIGSENLVGSLYTMYADKIEVVKKL